MPRSSQSSGGFVIDAHEFSGLMKDLRGISKGLARQVQKELKTAVQPVVAQAKANASWSSRIPGTIRGSATAKGVSIRAGGPKAPDAAPFEHNGQPGTFRHPVYGNREVWVTQPARLFLAPAWQAKSDGVLGAVADAIVRGIAKAGR